MLEHGGSKILPVIPQLIIPIKSEWEEGGGGGGEGGREGGRDSGTVHMIACLLMV